MHKWFAAIALVSFILPTMADAQGRRGGGPGGGRGGGGRGGGPSEPVAGHGVEVPGYWARLDDPSHVGKGLKFVPMNDGMHVTTGQAAGIFWDPDNQGSAKYTVSARFTLARVPATQEAFGLFIGGQNLSEDSQQYTYYLIRPDGSYSIRRRMGAKTTAVTDWTKSPAVMPASGGKMSNELSIQVAGDSVIFMANGKQVAKHPAKAVDTEGAVGLRVNHNLDVQIDDFVLNAAESG